MTRGKTVVIILLFAGLNLARQLLPEQSLQLRERLTEIVERESDYGALTETLGSQLREKDLEDSLVAVFGLIRASGAEDSSVPELLSMEPKPGDRL